MYLNEKVNREAMQAFEEFNYKLEMYRLEMERKERQSDFEM